MRYRVFDQEDYFLVTEEPLDQPPGKRVKVVFASDTIPPRWGVVLRRNHQTMVYVPEGFLVDREEVNNQDNREQTDKIPVKAIEVVVGEDTLVQPPQKLYVPVGYFVHGYGEGTLHVSCTTHTHHRPGQIHWSLYQQNPNLLLAKGHDRNSPGKIKATFPGWFPPGVYHLKAALYNNEADLIAEDEILWYCQSSRAALESGHGLSRKLPLFTNTLL